MSISIPGLGIVTKDPELGWLISEPIAVPMLRDHPGAFVLEEYELDEQKDDFHRVIARTLDAHPDVLINASEPLFDYYKDYEEDWLAEGNTAITTSSVLWSHVTIGRTLHISRRHRNDKDVYVSIECECDWEPEHGLQIVLRGGDRVTKLGPFDGHLNNADAWDNPALEDTIYVRS